MGKSGEQGDAAAARTQKTTCQFKFLWGPEPCEMFYIDEDECPCPKSRYRTYFARKVWLK